MLRVLVVQGVLGVTVFKVLGVTSFRVLKVVAVLFAVLGSSRYFEC